MPMPRSESKQDFILKWLQHPNVKVDIHTGNCVGVAGTVLKYAIWKGYCKYRINFAYEKRTVYAHHVVWMSVNGKIPCDKTIDHINQNKQDNRLCNLRLASYTEQMLNTPRTALTTEQRDIVRNTPSGPRCNKDLAERYGVGIEVINNIRNSHRWKRLPRKKKDQQK